jgi:hypothetical protein
MLRQVKLVSSYYNPASTIDSLISLGLMSLYSRMDTLVCTPCTRLVNSTKPLGEKPRETKALKTRKHVLGTAHVNAGIVP